MDERGGGMVHLISFLVCVGGGGKIGCEFFFFFFHVCVWGGGGRGGG